MGFLDTSILVGLIAAIATVLSASLPYYLTKRKEMDAKIKEIKLKRYDELLLKLTEHLANPNRYTLYGFIAAYNQTSGYADNSVIEECNKYLSLLELQLDKEKVDEAIVGIYAAIRKDIKPEAPYVKFEVFNVPPEDDTSKDEKDNDIK